MVRPPLLSPAAIATLLLLLYVQIVAAGLVTVKKYSYVCLESNQDLCMGISPGDFDPVFDPNNIYQLQVKSRSKNEEQMLDYRKLRWDLSYGDGKVSLSNFTDLCAAKIGNTYDTGLFPCNASYSKKYNAILNYGRWNLAQLKSNPNGAGTMMLARPSELCLTAMRCNQLPGNTFCNKDSTFPAYNKTYGVFDLTPGSYLKFRPCFNSAKGNPGWSAIQIWRQRLDCAAGCSPMLQDNDVCDSVCNNAPCKYDNGKCTTFAPTPPTVPKTASPTRPTIPRTSAPTPPTITASPTTHAPTPPTTHSPSTLTFKPTASPTTPCPPASVLATCQRFKTKRLCGKNKQAKKFCTYCLGSCQPKADPRACTVPGFYSNCFPGCPTAAVVKQCAKFKNKNKCTSGGRPCSWCTTTQKCQAGADSRVCTDPNFYKGCPAFSP